MVVDCLSMLYVGIVTRGIVLVVDVVIANGIVFVFVVLVVFVMLLVGDLYL